MADSALVRQEVWAHPGNYSPAAYSLPFRGVTIHHMAGVMTAERCGAVFQAPGRNASTNYGVSDYEVAQYVPEGCVAWHCGNAEGNASTISMELSNDCREAPWHMSDATFDTAARLTADILGRYGHDRAIPGYNIFHHMMWSATACPGDYMVSRFGEFADLATRYLQGGGGPVPVPDLVALNSWAPHAGKNQLWRIEPVDAGRCTIRSLAPSGKALDVQGGVYARMAPVCCFTPHGGTNQQWEVVREASLPFGDSYSIRPAGDPSLCLDLAGATAEPGAHLVLYPYLNALNQKWSLAPVADGVYRIASAANGMVLDLAGGV